MREQLIGGIYDKFQNNDGLLFLFGNFVFLENLRKFQVKFERY